jgi:hypothetical protein
MTTLSDAKLAALQTLTGATGHVNDLEALYLSQLVTGPAVSDTIQDLWDQVFTEAAIPAGQFNDRWYAYMDFILAPATQDGYNGRAQEYWEGGGTPIGPVAATLIHWFDFADPSQVFADTAGTIAAVPGDKLARVNNKGTNGTPLIESVATSQPWWRDAVLNGLNAVEVGGDGQDKIGAIIAAGHAASTSGQSMMVVGRRLEPNGTAVIWTQWGNDARMLLFGTNQHVIDFGANVFLNPIPAEDSWVMWYGSTAADDPADNFFISPGPEVNTPIANPADIPVSSLFQIGHTSPAGSLMQITEVRFWDGPLSGAQRSALVTEINTKYGTLPTFGTPPLQGNLQHWFDFADAATLFSDVGGTIPAVGGGVVRNITNKGTDGTDLIQAGTTMTRELAILHGKDVGRWTAAADLRANIAAAGGAAWTMAAVARRTDVDPLVPQVRFMRWGVSPGISSMGFIPDAAGRRVEGNHLSIPIGLNTQVQHNQNIWFGQVYAGDNVDSAFQATGGPEQAGPSSLGSNVPGASDFILGDALGGLTGEVGEVLVWDAKLSAADREAVFDYFNAKWGELGWIVPDEADLLHWFDFSDAQTLFQNISGTQPVVNSGDTIARVENKGTDLTPLLQPTAPLRPLWITNAIGGKSAADFNAAGPAVLTNTIVNGLAPSIQGTAIGAVARFNNSFAGDNDFFDWDGVGGAILRWAGLPVASRVVWLLAGSFTLVPTPATVNDWYLMYANFDNVGADDALFGSPGPEIVGAIGTPGTIGGNNIMSIQTQTWNIEIAEVFLWDRALTIGERATLVAHVNTKYGALPHP